MHFYLVSTCYILVLKIEGGKIVLNFLRLQNIPAITWRCGRLSLDNTQHPYGQTPESCVTAALLTTRLWHEDTVWMHPLDIYYKYFSITSCATMVRSIYMVTPRKTCAPLKMRLLKGQNDLLLAPAETIWGKCEGVDSGNWSFWSQENMKG